MDLVFLCVMIVAFTSLTNGIDPESTTCSAPAVNRGDAGAVTCYFYRNLKEVVPVSITVEHYPGLDSSEVTVLTCEWMDNTTKPTCRTSKGYDFDLNISTTLRLVITSASESQTGRYACKAMSKTFKPTPEPCDFRLAGTTTTTTTTTTPTTPAVDKGQSALIVSIVVPVLIVVVIAVIVILLVILHHKNKLTLPCQKRGAPETLLSPRKEKAGNMLKENSAQGKSTPSTELAEKDTEKTANEEEESRDTDRMLQSTAESGGPEHPTPELSTSPYEQKAREAAGENNDENVLDDKEKIGNANELPEDAHADLTKPSPDALDLGPGVAEAAGDEDASVPREGEKEGSEIDTEPGYFDRTDGLNRTGLIHPEQGVMAWDKGVQK